VVFEDFKGESALNLGSDQSFLILDCTSSFVISFRLAFYSRLVVFKELLPILGLLKIRLLIFELSIDSWYFLLESF